MISVKTKEKAQNLIIEGFKIISRDYKTMGGTTTFDNSVVSVDFFLKFGEISGTFEVYGKGFEDVKGEILYQLKPQYNNHSEISDSEEAKKKIKKDLKKVEDYLNKHINI